MRNKVFKIPHCPECDSANIMTRKDGERWCRRCGYEWSINDQFDQKGRKDHGSIKRQSKGAI